MCDLICHHLGKGGPLRASRCIPPGLWRGSSASSLAAPAKRPPFHRAQGATVLPETPWRLGVPAPFEPRPNRPPVGCRQAIAPEPDQRRPLPLEPRQAVRAWTTRGATGVSRVRLGGRCSSPRPSEKAFDGLASIRTVSGASRQSHAADIAQIVLESITNHATSAGEIFNPLSDEAFNSARLRRGDVPLVRPRAQDRISSARRMDEDPDAQIGLAFMAAYSCAPRA